MTQWFRWHAGTVEDAKFRVTARNAGVTVRDVIALWAFILEDAADDKHRGISTKGGDFVATVLDLEVEVVEVILAAMAKLEMVYLTPDGIKINNWGKRQYETDTYDNTNAERQRRWRNNHKPESKRDSNGTVTAAKPPETEAEAETESKKETRDASAREFALKVADEFLVFWSAYPEKVGKPAAAKAYLSARRKGDDPQAILDGLARYIKRKPADRAWLNPATFLNQQRWNDQPAGSVEAPITKPLVQIHEGTEEMDAWDRHWRQTRGVNAPRSKHGGIFVETQWPPGEPHARNADADQSPRP